MSEEFSIRYTVKKLFSKKHTFRGRESAGEVLKNPDKTINSHARTKYIPRKNVQISFVDRNLHLTTVSGVIVSANSKRLTILTKDSNYHTRKVIMRETVKSVTYLAALGYPKKRKRNLTNPQRNLLEGENINSRLSDITDKKH